ncbi:MAG: prepilin-type N-terminal cleavage/methylation domain-containing protein [Bacilli bacterium]|nr:prepilin-type N-terminal cleavage/methylation domain-containing protein [Bacilli bacterium]
MNKKGFTLIELLAVIVILAIIAIISVPIITDLINKSRYGAFGVTKKNIEHAAELYYAKNADDIFWEDNISYVTIGTLKSKKFLRNNVVNTLDSTSINDDTKVLLYRKGRKIDYSLQLYDEQFFDWYQGQMVQASKKEDITLPTNVGDIVTVDLEVLMNKGLVDELRLPLELDSRCVGYVEIEKTADNYEYIGYVDCLQGASTFASHYVSYGGKYLDNFIDIIETSDGGYIAVGESNSEVITKYGTGNNGKYDAIIVKFDSNGNVEWSHNFGGTNNEIYHSVAEVPDGYVAVGTTSSIDGDLENIYKGGTFDGMVVKYDKQGKLLKAVTHGTSATTYRELISKVIYDGENLVMVGVINVNAKDGDAEGLVTELTSEVSVIVKMDKDLNIIWRNLFGGTRFDYFSSLKKTTDNGYIVVGYSNSNNYDMEGIGYTDLARREAIIVKYNNDGTVQYKNSFKGSNQDYFYDVVEVNDGYVAVGTSNSTDLGMQNLNKSDNGYFDAIIVKFNKSLSNVIWAKSYGGTFDDYFNGITKTNTNELIVVGNSRSTDMDMSSITISSNGYSNAIIIKYDSADGNLLDKKSFGGSNSEIFNNVIAKTDNNYVVTGQSFSVDGNLKNFNKGHSDGILVKYDNNLNLVKSLKEPVILIDKLKTIVPNYGTNINNNNYENIYTTNNPQNDLGAWCSENSNYGLQYNYKYGSCLIPFNNDDIKQLTNNETINGLKKVYLGEKEYNIDINPDNNYNWHLIYMNFVNSSWVELSNFKVKFSDGYVSSIEDATKNGYLEPLVIVSNSISRLPIGDNRYFFPTPVNLIYTDGTTGKGITPSVHILIKPKKNKLTSIIFTSSKETESDGLKISELRNFDMSITPTE